MAGAGAGMSGPKTEEGPEEEAEATPYAWFVLVVLILLYTLSFIDRQILSLLVDPIQASLGIGDTAIGLLQGFAFAIFYTFMGIPLGRLADRASRRTLIAGGLAFWSLATAACGLAQTFTQLFLARVGVGVGEAALSPAAQGLITDYFPRRRIGLAQSLYGMAIPIGGGLALVIGGAVAEAARTAGPITAPLIGQVAAWQVTFFIVGLPGLALLPLVAMIREPKRRVFNAAPRADAGNARAFLRSRWGFFALLFLGMAALTTYAYANVAWLPTYFIRVHGWDRATVGLFYGLTLAVFGCAGLVCGGLFSDRLMRRGRGDAHLLTAIGAVAILVLPGIAAPLAPTPLLSLALLSIVIFFGAMPTGCAAAMVQLVTPPDLRGTMVAVQLFVMNLIGFGIGPLLIGFLTESVFADPRAVGRSLSLTVGVCSVLGGCLLLAARRPYRRALASA